MITEDYVSFEVAKLLKEKGFHEKVNHVYHYYTTAPFYQRHLRDFNGEDYKNLRHEHYSAPTLQMAMKWLREVYRILILVEYDSPVFSSDIYKMDDIDEYGSAKHVPPTFANCKNYEQAIETAIKYCLENLI